MLPGMGAYRMKNWRQLFRPACRVTEVTEVTNIMTLNAMKARRQEPGVEAWLKALELEIHDAWLSFKAPGRQGICQVRLSAQSG